MEPILVLAIIIVSIAYTIIRVIRITKSKNSPCCDCPGCAFKEQMQQKGGNPCSECKKSDKKFC